MIMDIDIMGKRITTLESAAASLSLQATPKVPQLVVLAMVGVQVLEEDQD
jgi:hypothetical protein